MSPTISIVVPAYNEERTLPACLDSLCQQSCTFPYEIIGVDNTSADRTTNIVRQFGVRLIDEPQKGVALARRTGFAAAQANIIASTDADCIVPPDWLTKIRHAFQERPSLIAIGGNGIYYDAPAYLNLFTHITRQVNLLQLVGKMARQQPLSTQNMAVRKEAYEQVGGFNQDITSPLGLDDVDLSLRLSAVGLTAVLPDLVVWTSARRFRQEPVKTMGYRWANYASYALRQHGTFRQKTANVRL